MEDNQRDTKRNRSSSTMDPRSLVAFLEHLLYFCTGRFQAWFSTCFGIYLLFLDLNNLLHGAKQRSTKLLGCSSLGHWCVIYIIGMHHVQIPTHDFKNCRSMDDNTIVKHNFFQDSADDFLRTRWWKEN